MRNFLFPITTNKNKEMDLKRKKKKTLKLTA